MSDTVIQVRNLSKRYRIGVREKADTFAEQLKSVITYPVKNFRRITNLNRFNGADDPSIFWALKDIHFDVKQGEVLGIIGKNGAGKSTLLKILSRITEPTTGEVRIKGRVSSLLEVGTGFHPELTGRDNVYMNGTIHGMSKKEIDRKFDEIVDFAGVETHIDTPVKFYSSGMKVRLGFAVAAHLEPEILIIDEVLAVGDAEFQKKCLGKMDDVSKSGRTVLFVSHNMGAVENLCSEVIVIQKGEILISGNAKESITTYLSVSSANENIKLPIRPKNYNPLDVFFKKINLLNSNGVYTNNFRFGESFIIEIEIGSSSDLQDLSLICGIDSFEQKRIFTSVSSQKDIKLTIKNNHSVRILISYRDLILHPGTYHLFLSIRKGRKIVYDTIQINSIIQINEASYNDKVSFEGHYGFLRVDPNWIIEHISN